MGNSTYYHSEDDRTHLFNETNTDKRKTVTIFQTASNANTVSDEEKYLRDTSRINSSLKLKDYGKEHLANEKVNKERNIKLESKHTIIDDHQSILESKSISGLGRPSRMSSYNMLLKKSSSRNGDRTRRSKKDHKFYNYCLFSVCCSFLVGLVTGIILMGSTQIKIYQPSSHKRSRDDSRMLMTLNSLRLDAVTDDYFYGKKQKKDHLNRFTAVSFTDGHRKHHPLLSFGKKDVYPKDLTDDMKDILKDSKMENRNLDKYFINNVKRSNKIESYVPNDRTVLYENVFWGPEVENSMPQGYGPSTTDIWERYVNQSEVASLETGCGRMQNRLVTFKDGIQACVRYRQNIDQIQGEIFSFYVAKLLKLPNVAPSVVKVVDVKDKLWKDVATDIAAAQWNNNRPVVLTQYIPSLELAKIPDVFKPANRHLNKNDVMKISMKENNENKSFKKTLTAKKNEEDIKGSNNNISHSFDHIEMDLNKKTIDLFVELAQWSDLIIFDYLMANLDRIVNNLFNFQWNVNIMDGPAHNLARKMDSGLLLFLDNESGLLHGYRLLKKYNVYHSAMLDNLCVFRKTTVDALRSLRSTIGNKLSDMFHERNNDVIRDILPPLPEKNTKILLERIEKVLSQIEKCQRMFSNR